MEDTTDQTHTVDQVHNDEGETKRNSDPSTQPHQPTDETPQTLEESVKDVTETASMPLAQEEQPTQEVEPASQSTFALAPPLHPSVSVFVDLATRD